MTNVTTLMRQLGFGPIFDVRGKSDLSGLLNAKAHLGIYVLYFQDGSYYVGQSIDVDQRFKQHRHYWKEPICGFSFKPVKPYELDEEERIAIEGFKALRKSLPKEQQFQFRNIKGNEYRRGEADFDFVMPPIEQDKWLADTNKTDIRGKRAEYPELRTQYAERFQRKFLKKPFAQDVLEVTRAYVRATIPAMLQTEAVFWAASCLPKSYVYTRINIYWQEIFTACDIDGILFSFHMAFEPTGLPEGVMRLFNNFSDISIDSENVVVLENPDEFPNIAVTEQEFNELGFTGQYRRDLVRDLKIFFANIPTALISSQAYRPGGRDQINITVTDKRDALNLISEPNFRRAMREMNLRLMRLGPCRWAGNHCMDLADHFTQ